MTFWGRMNHLAVLLERSVLRTQEITSISLQLWVLNFNTQFGFFLCFIISFQNNFNLQQKCKDKKVQRRPLLTTYYKYFTPFALLCSSVTQPCPTLCNPMNCSTPGFPVLHHLLFAQTHVHWIGDAIQSPHPLPSPSPPAFNLFQHQGLFHWVGSSNQVAKILELQLQHQSFQWIFRVDFL